MAWGLWASFFAGPLAWSAHNLVSSALVSTACRLGAWPLYLITVVCEVAAIAGLIASVRHSGAESGQGQHFVAATAILVNGFFAVVVLVEGMPSLVLNPCWANR
jgi:hypothetical protein